MKFCQSCSVSYPQKNRYCALCGRDLVVFPSGQSLEEIIEPFPQRFDEVESTPQKIIRKRGLWILILTICFGMPAMVSLVVDILVDPGVTWSLFVMVSLSLAWSLSIITIGFLDYVLQMMVTFAMSIATHIFLLGMLQGSVAWVFEIAWPITLVSFLVIILVLVVAKVAGKNYHYVGALVLVGVCIIGITVEVSVTRFFEGSALVQWSFIVLVACIPVAALQLIIGIWYKRSPWLQRVLHW